MTGMWKKGAVALLLLILVGILIILFGRKDSIRYGTGRFDLTYDGLYLKQFSAYIDDKQVGISMMPPKTIFFWNAYREVNHPQYLWAESMTRPCGERGVFKYHSLVHGEDVLVSYDGNCDGTTDASVLLGPHREDGAILLPGDEAIVLRYTEYGMGFIELPPSGGHS